MILSVTECLHIKIITKEYAHLRNVGIRSMGSTKCELVAQVFESTKIFALLPIQI